MKCSERETACLTTAYKEMIISQGYFKNAFATTTRILKILHH
jgi:hypothetical protein